MSKRQRLLAVEVKTRAVPVGAPAIVPVTGEALDEVLESWRIVGIEPLGADGAMEGRFAALLLLEEVKAEGEGKGLGFRVP
ncbi:MAG TPA: hypothetical protein VHQ90_23435 [Thermoanaerobaculia bacterium]|nr:hypothetical protein [Thermoanaerobaculia bacterium]